MSLVHVGYSCRCCCNVDVAAAVVAVDAVAAAVVAVAVASVVARYVGLVCFSVHFIVFDATAP